MNICFQFPACHARLGTPDVTTAQAVVPVGGHCNQMTKISSDTFPGVATTLFHNILCFNFIWNLTKSNYRSGLLFFRANNQRQLPINDWINIFGQYIFPNKMQNSLSEMIFWIGISADTTQPSFNQHEQPAHSKLKWKHTQNSISNQPKAQAGHMITDTLHCP